MVQYGGIAVRAVPLNNSANALCLAIGAFSLVWGVIIKVILPPRCFNRLALDQREMTDLEEEKTVTSFLKKSFR
jgi:hypothetical protein